MKFGQAPVPMTLGPLPEQAIGMPPELAVVEHRVGYTECLLANGDRIRIHLHVDKMVYDPATGCYMPSYRVIPEVIIRQWRGGVDVLPRPLS